MVTGWVLFFFGAAGGLAAEFVNVRGLFNDDRRAWNRDRRKPTFWMLAFGFCLLGGVTAFAHGYGSQLSALLAMNVGFTWPLLLRRGVGALPGDELGTVD